jgi:addiction module HigA family antidote
MEDAQSVRTPGEVLRVGYLEARGVSAYRLAKETGLPLTRVAAILHGKRRVTADTALRFGRFFGTGPEFWLALQDDWDIYVESKELGPELDAIVPLDDPVPSNPSGSRRSLDDLPAGWRVLDRPYKTKD